MELLASAVWSLQHVTQNEDVFDDYSKPHLFLRSTWTRERCSKTDDVHLLLNRNNIGGQWCHSNIAPVHMSSAADSYMADTSVQKGI